MGLCSVSHYSWHLCFLNFVAGQWTFLIALDKKTGKNVWKVDFLQVQPPPRPPPPPATDRRRRPPSRPTGISVEGRNELIVSFPEQVRAFDRKTGKELRVCDGRIL